LNARIGKSDFAAKGTLDNLLNYVFADDKLKGTLSLRSNNLDLNEFMTETTTTETTSDTVLDVKVPENIDFVINGTFNSIQYDKIALKNVSGVLTVRDETVRISNLVANVFNGSILANGTYSTKNEGNPEISFDYDLKNIDFQQAYKGLDMMATYAPILKNVNGKFNSKLNITGRLGEDLSPDLKTLIGDGLLEVSDVKISGVETLNKIADKFKLNQLKNLSLDKAWTVFKFKNGRMEIDPTDLKLNDMMLNFSGSHGLDNTLDYKVLLDAPTKYLQGAMGEVNNMVSQAKIPGLTNAALPSDLKLKIDVTGTMDNPQLKFGVAGIGSGSLKDNAKELFDQKKKELEDKARAEFDSQKDTAQEEFNKQKAEAEAKARAEADKAKKEAEERARKEAEKAKQQAKDQIKDKLKFPR
jgi:hypothetical protein